MVRPQTRHFETSSEIIYSFEGQGIQHMFIGRSKTKHTVPSADKDTFNLCDLVFYKTYDAWGMSERRYNMCVTDLEKETEFFEQGGQLEF
jgi:hypothetical protein